tara:strand:+ start:2814 stop:3002 length:189 start_codon:yes stop_codon:yes gene_type:complete
MREYDWRQTAVNYFTLEQSDANNHKRDKDIEVGVTDLILTSANGTRYNVVVSDAGVLSAVAV